MFYQLANTRRRNFLLFSFKYFYQLKKNSLPSPKFCPKRFVSPKKLPELQLNFNERWHVLWLTQCWSQSIISNPELHWIMDFSMICSAHELAGSKLFCHCQPVSRSNLTRGQISQVKVIV